MNAVFVNGWGISQSAVRDDLIRIGNFDSVAVVQPVRNWKDLVSSLAGQADVLIGYSTGAFLMMSSPDLADAFDRRVLLAPFFDFKKESNLGGKTRGVQLKYLLKWLKRDPLEALSDFYTKSGIGYELPQDLPVSPMDLTWGIEQLLNESRSLESFTGCEVFVGRDDVLLDAVRMKELSDSVSIVDGVGHELEGLLEAWCAGGDC